MRKEYFKEPHRVRITTDSSLPYIMSAVDSLIKNMYIAIRFSNDTSWAMTGNIHRDLIGNQTEMVNVGKTCGSHVQLRLRL